MSSTLVLTGAGFSIPFLEYKQHTLNTAFLTRLFTDLELNREVFAGLYPKEEFPNQFEEIVRFSALLHDALRNERTDVPCNFEYLFNLLLEEVRYREYKDSGRGILFNLRCDPRSYGSSDLVHFQEYLLDIVGQFKIKQEHTSVLRGFVDNITEHGSMRYYTLNYDDLLLQALCHSNTEEDHVRLERDFNLGCRYNTDGGQLESKFIFDELNKGIPRKHCLFHLHGSVAYSTFNETLSVRRMPRPTLSPSGRKLYKSRIDSYGSQANEEYVPMSRDEKSFITGVHKAEQMMVYPYSMLYQSFIRDYHRCDKLIVVGYSFNDPHINAALSSENPNVKKITIVDYWPIDEADAERKERYRLFLNMLISKTNNFGLDTGQFEVPSWNLEAPQGKLVIDRYPRYGFDEEDMLEIEYDFNGTLAYIERVIGEVKDSQTIDRSSR